MARCTICKRNFHIDSSGKTQVTTHSKTKGHIQLSKADDQLSKYFSNSNTDAAASSMQRGNIFSKCSESWRVQI